MTPRARLQFVFLSRRAQGANSGRPPRAPQAGVAVPDGPVCTTPPPCSMPPRSLPHERRIPHCPPSPQLLQLIAPLVPLGVTTAKAGCTSEDSAAVRRAHSWRHLLVIDHDRAPAG
eukprot:2437704-Prymnesium_polylepis.2